jgi:hypothetical protein
MAKQLKTVHKKSRGRPSGKTYSETIPARLEPTTVASLDAWAATNNVSRSEAIRRLVEIGLTLKAKASAKREDPIRRQGTKGRARELAGNTIDKLTDATASADDQAVRKSRLLKGPEEFRAVRIDRPNRKARS